MFVWLAKVSTSKAGKHGHAKCHFVAIDIFTSKKLEDIVPHVNRTNYQLIDISEDGFVSLLTDNGSTKDDLKLPTDETLLTQLNAVFEEGKDSVVSVMSAMGEEPMCALKDSLIHGKLKYTLSILLLVLVVEKLLLTVPKLYYYYMRDLRLLDPKGLSV
ncbi:hypothetical protein AALP_AA2G119700 [Arabis alpina]|uniref:Translation initiation factor 5A C-terminal domain-containing protein n=1 Tax=Arabis alpina TaxID=50452 RepID=A0A087HGV5_ARAAL|nr:hypothetical protein AALP_AA2G119700 [Arabis alpina]